jgi:hypothetical protein
LPEDDELDEELEELEDEEFEDEELEDDVELLVGEPPP